MYGYSQGLVVAYQTARPGYVDYVVQHASEQEDGYAVWGINQYGEREGIAGAQTLPEAMREMASDVYDVRARHGITEGPGPVVLDELVMAEHPGYLDGLVEASLAKIAASSPRTKTAAGIRAREGLPENECLAEGGFDPEDCDCSLCDQ